MSDPLAKTEAAQAIRARLRLGEKIPAICPHCRREVWIRLCDCGAPTTVKHQCTEGLGVISGDHLSWAHLL